MFFIVTQAAYANRVKFMLSEDICYDDNIYLRKHNRVSSIISSTQLHAKYGTHLPGTNLNVGVNANIGYHAYSEKPSQNNYWNAGLGVSLGNRYFTLSDRLVYTADGINPEIERAKRFTNIASLQIRVPLSRKFSLVFFFFFTLYKYIEDEYERLNRNRIDLGAKLYYHLTAKTSLYFSYMFYSIKYEKNDYYNSFGHVYSLGITGKLAPKVTGDARVSYTTRGYEIDNKEVDTWGYYLSLKYTPTNRSLLILSGERTIHDSSYRTNRYYVSTGVTLEYKQRIAQKWTAGIAVSYLNIDYPRSHNSFNRIDDYIGIKPSIEYRIRDNLIAMLYYHFRCRLSNYDSVEYTNNRVGLQIRFYF